MKQKQKRLHGAGPGETNAKPVAQGRPRLNTLEGNPVQLGRPRLNTLEGNPVQLGREDGGQKSEVRDRISAFENLRFRHTWDIIKAAEKGLLPDKIMINVHPQRWTDQALPWVKELVLQNVKNVVKKHFVGYRLK